MATTFLEPGGDATFDLKIWTNTTATIVSDIVHGSHLKSIKYTTTGGTAVTSPTGVLADAGSRISFYVYFTALPTSAKQDFVRILDSGGSSVVRLYMTSGGILQLWNAATAQIGINGTHTLSTGVWYRISLAYTITSTATNRFELFVNGASDISVTNGTLDRSGSNKLGIGVSINDATFDYRSSDHYIDDSASLIDTGDIWVTAKRPNANGTTNGFTTQIGSGGSGYGSGHSPQVNERALSTTNGWSMIGAGSAVTEEYNIESASTGDIDISGSQIQIIDYIGWIYTSALVGETVNIILNGVNFAQAITSSNTMYTKVAGSTTYPAGTGADIGEQTDTSLTTVSLYECGVVVAYIPKIPTMGYLKPNKLRPRVFAPGHAR